jgi:hypothetical protein
MAGHRVRNPDVHEPRRPGALPTGFQTIIDHVAPGRMQS